MEKESKKHFGEEQLEAYAAHRLAGEELDKIEEHLLICATCQDRLDAVERFGKAMRSAAMLVREEEKQTTQSPGWRKWVRGLLRVPIPVWAGAAAMGAVLLVIVSLPPRDRPTQHPPPAPPGPPITVQLQAFRGESAGTAQAGHALHLEMDGKGITEMPVWQVEIVDSEGGKIWNGKGVRSDTMILADVPLALLPGTYYVRLIKSSSAVDPSREFELDVK